MSLVLELDIARWRSHQDRLAAQRAHIVPVVKGNGYGYGIDRLAGEAGRLGASTVAVGEPEEAAAVLSHAGLDVLVMAPWRPEWAARFPPESPRVVRTISHADALGALRQAHPGARLVLEGLTSMNRHGLPPEQLSAALTRLAGLRWEGIALHLPIDGGDHSAEVARWLDLLDGAGQPTAPVWVSHLDASAVDRLRRAHPQTVLRPRVGTALWLGDAGAFRAVATVLDVRRIAAGEAYGYRQRRAPRDGTLLVVSGGTSHGIGMEAPKAAESPLARARVLAGAAVAASGRALSPFHVAGRKRWFAEPPHMQVSLLLLPRGVQPPRIGTEVELDVRMTTTTFDVVREV